MLYPVELRAPPRESANLRRENVASTQAPSDLTFSKRLSIVEHESPTSQCGPARNSHGMTICSSAACYKCHKSGSNFFVPLREMLMRSSREIGGHGRASRGNRESVYISNYSGAEH